MGSPILIVSICMVKPIACIHVNKNTLTACVLIRSNKVHVHGFDRVILDPCLNSQRASNAFNQVAEVKRFEGVFL